MYSENMGIKIDDSGENILFEIGQDEGIIISGILQRWQGTESRIQLRSAIIVPSTEHNDKLFRNRGLQVIILLAFLLFAGQTIFPNIFTDETSFIYLFLAFLAAGLFMPHRRNFDDSDILRLLHQQQTEMILRIERRIGHYPSLAAKNLEVSPPEIKSESKQTNNSKD